MDSQSLTLLVEIIDSGNLSQAARKLKMTRANVSYHLAQLEKAAGVQLVGFSREATSLRARAKVRVEVEPSAVVIALSGE